MRALVCALLVVAGDAATAATWIAFAESRLHRFEVQRRSARITLTPAGEEAAITRGRIVDKATRTTDRVSWAVTRADCARGLGTLVVLDPAGSLRSRADFVFNSGTVASRMAASLCTVFTGHPPGGAPRPPAGPGNEHQSGRAPGLY